MAKLYAGRFNRFVEKLFNTKEGRSSLDTISPEIGINYTVLTGVEDRYLQEWRRYGFFSTVTAVAADFGAIEIRPPSNIIAVIEYVTVDCAVNTPFRLVIQPGTTDLSTTGTGNRIDARGAQASASIASTGVLVSLSTLGRIVHGNVLANSMVQLINNPNQELTILPGDLFSMQCDTPNQAVTFSVMWRERVLESSELS
jgi:hypothetical protein